MTKKLLFLLAVIGFTANITSCTSKKSQDETEIVENADVDKIDAESQGFASPTETAGSDDDALRAALGETNLAIADGSDTLNLDTPTAVDETAAAATETVTATSPDIAAAPTLDETSLDEIPAPADMPATDVAELTPALDVAVDTNTDTSPAPMVTANENSYAEVPLVESNIASTYTSAPTPKPGSVLKKVATTAPYQVASGWVNTVYVARPGENLKEISQMIYATDKTKELKKIDENSYLRARPVKAGDKIYYVSPNRADDSSKMLVYYEDMGMVPETYVAKKGDRLRKVSKEILGYDKAWVEMWTSNPVESKDKLAEGETLKYWKSSSSINTTTLAQNTPPPQDSNAQLIDSSQMPPLPEAQTLPPIDTGSMADNNPPPTDMNSMPPDMNSLPPPPSEQAMAANMEPPPSEPTLPPPPPEMAPPPPPPMEAIAPPPSEGEPVVAKKKFTPVVEEEASGIDSLDQETMMSLAAVGVLTAALAFVLIRRKKKKAMEQAMTEHNVGT
jgi:LPXTG-motif cell wall-anchored protein